MKMPSPFRIPSKGMGRPGAVNGAVFSTLSPIGDSLTSVDLCCCAFPCMSAVHSSLTTFPGPIVCVSWPGLSHLVCPMLLRPAFLPSPALFIVASDCCILGNEMKIVTQWLCLKKALSKKLLWVNCVSLIAQSRWHLFWLHNALIWILLLDS